VYGFSTAGGGGGRREAVKIGRSRVSLKSLIGIAHNGFPLGGAPSSSLDLMRGVGPRSARNHVAGYTIASSRKWGDTGARWS
jgi:hypothetical protein